MQTQMLQGGFTVIELVVVMALLMIVSSLGLFMSMETLRGGSFRNDRGAVISALQRARSLAVNNMCFGGSCTDGQPHGVYFGAGGEVVIFQGTAYDPDDAANETVAFDSGATSIAPGSDQKIIFDHLSGNLLDVSAAEVTVADGAGRESVVTVNSEGRIDWNN